MKIRIALISILAIALISMLAMQIGCWDKQSNLLSPTIDETWEEYSGDPPKLDRPVVRVFYQYPYNATRSAEEVQANLRIIDGIVKDAQRWFADEMERHGYGRKTFVLQTRRTGELVIQRDTLFTVDNSGNSHLVDAITGTFEPYDIDLWFIDVADGTKTLCGDGGGDGARVFRRCWDVYTVAHELGHCFGLMHDWRNGNYVMSYGVTHREGKTYKATNWLSELSPDSAGWLNLHPAFNEGPHDGRITTLVQDVRLVNRTPNNDNTERLVFEFLAYHHPLVDYTYHNPLGWLLTYGILFDTEEDSIVTGFDIEDFNYSFRHEINSDNRVEYRVAFDAKIRQGMTRGHLLFISQDGFTTFIGDGGFRLKP